MTDRNNRPADLTLPHLVTLLVLAMRAGFGARQLQQRAVEEGSPRLISE